MHQLIVTIRVKDFDALQKFEAYAQQTMAKYRGKISKAFETVRNADGSGEEIHWLQFANSNEFEAFLRHSHSDEMAILRSEAIDCLVLKPVLCDKSY